MVPCKEKRMAEESESEKENKRENRQTIGKITKQKLVLCKSQQN